MPAGYSSPVHAYCCVSSPAHPGVYETRFGFVFGHGKVFLSMGQPSKAVVFRRRKKKGKM